MSRLSLYCEWYIQREDVKLWCFAVCLTSMKTCMSVTRAICDVMFWRVCELLWMQKHHEEWCVVPWPPSSCLSIPTATVVWNCAFNSSIYCACLQKHSFSFFILIPPGTGYQQYDIAHPWQSDYTGNILGPLVKACLPRLRGERVAAIPQGS